MAFLFDRNILEIDSNPKHDIKPLKFQRRIRENLQAKLLAKCNFRKIRKKNHIHNALESFVRGGFYPAWNYLRTRFDTLNCRL